jgi:hypothetical protein
MDGKLGLNQLWLPKTLICMVLLGLFAAEAQAQLGLPPIIAVQPLGLAVQNGGTAILTTTAVSLTPITKFSWLLNGQPVPTTNTTVLNVVVPLVGTVSTLTVNGISAANAGNYSVKITNGGGTATSGNAAVIVLSTTVSNVVNFVATGTGLTSSGFKIQLSGPSDTNYVIQASTDLKNWTSIYTNAAPTGGISYTDTTANSFSFRYYRAKLQ